MCARYHINPSRSKGQNFLIDEDAYEAMIEAAQLKKDDSVLEVGPGLGFLTERLAKRAQKVFAVELDDRLSTVVRKRMQSEGISNVTIYNQDILNFASDWVDDMKQVGKHLKVVANLPYNITSYFLRKFVAGNEGSIYPKTLTLLLQKEVGERVAASAGAMSLLSVSVQLHTRVTLLDIVPKESFWPVPQVDSVIVSLERDDVYLKQLKHLDISEKVFFRLVRISFSARRKVLVSNLTNGLHLEKSIIIRVFEKVKIPTNARPQELSLENWLNLIAALQEYMV